MAGVREILSRLPIAGVAVVWAVAALAKVLTPADEQSWATEFPDWLMVGVVLIEASVPALIFAGRVRIGLLVGMFLLLAFVGALLLNPPSPGQSCGCGGAVSIATSPADIASHVFALGGLHLLAAACVRGMSPSQEESALDEGLCWKEN